MSSVQQEYNALHALSTHIATLGGISQLLGWDQETYMPSAATAFRAQQLKAIAAIMHKEHTSAKYKQALSKLIDLRSGEVPAKGLKIEQQAALKRWRTDYLKAKALPTKFVEEFVRLASQAQSVWRHAREANAFQQFAPFLEKIIIMNRQKADYLGYDEHPYDALLDEYEPDITTKDVRGLFTKLKSSVAGLLKRITKAKQVDDSFLHGEFPQEDQIKFATRVLGDMGYDFSRGRLDFSTHPFSSGSHPTDSRITTRIHPSMLMSNIKVVLHEGGHSLYGMGLPAEHFGSPLGEAISMGVHESQSRWWETRIGQSKAYWEYYLPELKKAFPMLPKKLTVEQLYRAINKVEPGFIRVEADEVTYPLHVILRFELETQLIEGSLSVRDVPEAWNAKMKELLGIVPPDNRLGCLQDIHWSMGAFGYFPTYTLGNIYAAHLFNGFESEYPDWQKRVAKGELLFIKDWLNKNVHEHGRRYTSKELLKKATGKALTSQAYEQYLNDKYAEIYKV